MTCIIASLLIRIINLVYTSVCHQDMLPFVKSLPLDEEGILVRTLLPKYFFKLESVIS